MNRPKRELFPKKDSEPEEPPSEEEIDDGGAEKDESWEYWIRPKKARKQPSFPKKYPDLRKLIPDESDDGNTEQKTPSDFWHWIQPRAQAEAGTYSESLPAILYILEIVCAELLAGLVSPIGGIVLHAIVILTLMVHSSLAYPDPKYRFYVSLSLIPLIRVLSLSIPLEGLAGESQTSWYFIIAVPLLAGTFMAIRTLKYSRSDIFLVTGNIPIQILIAATGVSFGIAQYYAVKPESFIDTLTLENAFLPTIALLLATGFTLELIFRGILQRSSLDAFGDRGLFFVALAFAVIHISGLSAAEIGLAFLMGLYFCWVVKRTGAIWGVMLSHGIANITALLIIPFYS